MAAPQNLCRVLRLIAMINEVRSVEFGVEMVQTLHETLYLALLKHGD